ncbi:DUF116 domain-containing protein [Desulfovibrio oxamicus]|uniref:DUF116 domain-containing protein n=1 Tax=Nitratidesulfovibrio oxamicus TaxID=32016 RepID=A0ABS0IZB2_9BACT|nr:DUF116 domain-containing protein [Nitratidesulfovibrio oxamicus]MBG3875535.1 DUF116 domain-containing protein [Nitratidesulfovibrio oxamicus]
MSMPIRKNPHSLPREDYHGARKRLFIGLISLTSAALCLVLLVGWIIPYIGLGNIHPLVPDITGALLVACIALIVWATLGLVLHIYTGRPWFGSQRVRGVAVKLFLPLMELLGRLFGISREEVRHSFIKVNNELVRGETGSFAPSDVLILLPHCLQSSNCAVRLTYGVDHCKRCGLCPIEQLLALRDRYGVKLAIATGGTIARRIVVKERPRLIIAVACERDLASGIQDTHPIPVYGVLNERPNGPCLDTLVSLANVEKALRHFLNVLPPDLGEKDTASAAAGASAAGAPGSVADATFGAGGGNACQPDNAGSTAGHDHRAQDAAPSASSTAAASAAPSDPQ